MIMSIEMKILLIIWVTYLKESSSSELQIFPERDYVSVGTRTKIMCQSNEPIVACQFKRSFAKTIYDLSLGDLTPSTRDYAYYGIGLEHGQCGINLREYANDFLYDLVGCRARTRTGGWMYAQMSLFINANQTFFIKMLPRSVIVLPGSSVNLMCQADQALSSCHFKMPAELGWQLINESAVTTQVKYYGKGLDKGQCGVTILNVTEKNNGNVFCNAWTKAKPKGHEADTIPVVVAKPPSVPTLSLNTSDYNEGDTLVATCHVTNSRPVANVTWFADDVVLREDSRNEAPPEAAWRWSYDLQEIRQTLEWVLSWEDNGKGLKCQARHLALEGRKLDSGIWRINVKYSPRNISQPITINHLRFGEKGQILVNISANPKPTITWNIGGRSFREGQLDPTGRFEAVTPSSYEEDVWKWKVALIIAKADQLDFSHDFFLTARNVIGGNTYRISVVFNTTEDTTVISKQVSSSTTTEEIAAVSTTMVVQDFDESKSTVTITASVGCVEPLVPTSETSLLMPKSLNLQDSNCHLGIGLGVLALILIITTVVGLLVKALYFTPKAKENVPDPLCEEVNDLTETGNLRLDHIYHA